LWADVRVLVVKYDNNKANLDALAAQIANVPSPANLDALSGRASALNDLKEQLENEMLVKLNQCK
jgi:hypothetical protein